MQPNKKQTIALDEAVESSRTLAEEHLLMLMKAKLGFMAHSGATFFSTILLGLEVKYDEKTETASTNGLNILINLEFFMSLSKVERIGLLMHEVLHVALSHMTRCGDRKPGKFNRACDYSINLIAIDAGFTIPEGGLLDYSYRDMSPEEIYACLPNGPENSKNNDIVYVDSEEASKIQNQIDDLLILAEQAAAIKGEAGNIPLELQRHIDKLINPTVPWHAILRGCMQALARTNHDWKKPNKRYMNQEIIMPSIAGKKLSNGAVAIDVSGSFEQDQFEGAVSEAYTIFKKLSPDALSLLQFDHTLKPVETIKSLNEFNQVEFHGGGGTNIYEPLEWAKENNPSFLVVFTDGFFEMIDLKLKCPVIWLIFDNPNFEAPYGKVINYVPPE